MQGTRLGLVRGGRGRRRWSDRGQRGAGSLPCLHVMAQRGQPTDAPPLRNKTLSPVAGSRCAFSLGPSSGWPLSAAQCVPLPSRNLTRVGRETFQCRWRGSARCQLQCQAVGARTQSSKGGQQSSKSQSAAHCAQRGGCCPAWLPRLAAGGSRPATLKEEFAALAAAALLKVSMEAAAGAGTCGGIGYQMRINQACRTQLRGSSLLDVIAGNAGAPPPRPASARACMPQRRLPCPARQESPHLGCLLTRMR